MNNIKIKKIQIEHCNNWDCNKPAEFKVTEDYSYEAVNLPLCKKHLRAYIFDHTPCEKKEPNNE